MKICVMGLSASGKSFQARRLASGLRFEYVSGSAMLVDQLGCSDSNLEHVWLDESGDALDARRDQLPIDVTVDSCLLSLAHQSDNLVFDSWTLPWLYQGDDMVRVYLSASLDARAQMSYYSKEAKRYAVEELKALLRVKDESSRTRFMRMYSFDIYITEGFDIVFDNSHSSADETAAFLATRVSSLL